MKILKNPLNSHDEGSNNELKMHRNKRIQCNGTKM